MGRLSRYKKTKSCDPFYKGAKSDVEATQKNTKRSKSIDTEADVDEQKMPRSMKLLLERAKKLSVKKKKKLKRLDDKTGKTALFKKKKDESQREYLYRIDQETSLAVVDSLKSQKKMSDRRKSHLIKRKEKLKIKKCPERVFQKTAVDFSHLKDDVRFGDVASQPPMLTAKPRKASLQDKGKSPLLLSSKLTQDKVSSKPTEDRKKQSKNLIVKAKRRKHMSEAEKAVMDKERLRVIELYRTSKKKA
ncbi:coiled-coil domain-containing protein 137 [Exaiptasia diaphana]|uniref:Uncharacterized protein n=1 Tax=Exaiptasia diaphana TaxID=2652724 RepID=A0A913Y9R5_EXADI|nr:coiled-coil domain-containing protein 137 [Exaiptasia diaphana]KXJ21665.1 hypothetical protein AC249_AIPGENE12746 [Exaiptasia diaphana]